MMSPNDSSLFKTLSVFGVDGPGDWIPDLLYDY